MPSPRGLSPKTHIFRKILIEDTTVAEEVYLEIGQASQLVPDGYRAVVLLHSTGLIASELEKDTDVDRLGCFDCGMQIVAYVYPQTDLDGNTF